MQFLLTRLSIQIEIIERLINVETLLERHMQNLALKEQLNKEQQDKVNSLLKTIESKKDAINDGNGVARSIEYLHEIVYNMARETEAIAQSLKNLFEKPEHEPDVDRLERCIERTVARVIQKTIESEVAKSVELTMTKLINTKFQDSLQKIPVQLVPKPVEMSKKLELPQELEGTTWTCSSQDKIHIRQKRISKKKAVKNRNLETSRTIIPWDEISSPPPVNYTSEI